MTDARKPLLIIGAGGHALACIDVIEQEGRFAVAGLVGRRTDVGGRVLDYPVVASDEDLAGLATHIPHALIAVGHIQTAEVRARLYSAAQAAGFSLPTIVSPRAYVSRHAQIGAGTLVMHGAVVGPGVRVGVNCIVNTRSHIEHGVIIGDHVHVSTAAVLNGDVKVGNRSFIGSGALVIEGASIPDGSVVPMGSHVGRKGMPRRVEAYSDGGAH